MKNIALSCASIFWAVAACQHSDINEERLPPSICDASGVCTLSGVLSSTSSIYGEVYMLEKNSLDGDQYCVAFSSEQPKIKRSRIVSLSGRFVERSEPDACIFVTYGNSNVPCGYCPGTNVFLVNGEGF